MTATVVELDVISKKEGHQWGQKGNPKEYEIEIAVGYDPTNVFYKQSGGTNMILKTINKDAADLFIVGHVVEMTIRPITVEVK